MTHQGQAPGGNRLSNALQKTVLFTLSGLPLPNPQPWAGTSILG